MAACPGRLPGRDFRMSVTHIHSSLQAMHEQRRENDPTTERSHDIFRIIRVKAPCALHLWSGANKAAVLPSWFCVERSLLRFFLTSAVYPELRSADGFSELAWIYVCRTNKLESTNVGRRAFVPCIEPEPHLVVLDTS